MSKRTYEKLNRIARLTDDPEIERLAQEGVDGLREEDDVYTRRVREFHEELRSNSPADYLTVLPQYFDPEDLPTPVETPHEAENILAEVIAERNRLFWSSFLSEECGEVSKCLNDGEPRGNLEKEVADVNVLCHAIADVFEFDLLEVFHDVMDVNDQKPKQQEGTGKLPAEARSQWREQ
jgi:NTP pyrophosphatase (non-canonical NTP hydrolase)